jgi:putative ABC transport system permease protein
VLAGFGLFALGLAAIGVGMLIVHAVRSRTRELGIRIALGANDRSVVFEAMRRAAQLVSAGVIFGAILALAASKSMSAVIAGFAEPNTLGVLAAGALMAIVALVASYLPARRAATIDPAIALRAE